jgi:hypothetical protein
MDTRLAALGRYSPKIAEELLLSGKYHTRKHNRFDKYIESVDQRAVDDIYKNRDVTLLQESVITPIVLMLSDMADRYKEVSAGHPVPMVMSLIVNTNPYVLDKELTETFREVLLDAIGAESVKFCNLPIELMTPSYLSSYDTVVWNELDAWVTLHHKELATKKMAEVTMYCPEIHVNPDVDTSGVHPLAPANELRMLLIEYVGFEILPLELYSAVRPT